MQEAAMRRQASGGKQGKQVPASKGAEEATVLAMLKQMKAMMKRIDYKKIISVLAAGKATESPFDETQIKQCNLRKEG